MRAAPTDLADSPALGLSRRAWLRRVVGSGLAAVLARGAALPLPAFAAEAPKFDEAELKAAFVLSFAGFAEWPERRLPAADTPLVLGVWGSPTVQQALEALVRRRPAAEHPRQVRRVEKLEEAKDCHTLFVDAAVSLGPVLPLAREQSLLLVGDSETFLSDGGHVQLVRRGDNLTFDVNQKTLENAGLKLSSKVLALARKVIRARETGTDSR